MKINRKNPKHLIALAVSGFYSCVVVGTRPVLRLKTPKYRSIIFYGHTLNGNLKVFYDYLNKQSGYRAYFLVLDKAYLARLKRNADNPQTILSAFSIKDMMKVATSDAFVTSHGLHFFSVFRIFTNIKFIDVWHAVSYKGFGYHELKHLHAHDAVWVSSEAMKKLYINRYGFDPAKIKVTGYARTDLLFNKKLSKDNILSKYKISAAKKYILIAPTWSQDVANRNILPFGVEEKVFFKELDELANKNKAHIIFRTHLNSSEEIKDDDLRHISFMPYSRYEVVEDFLFIADMLVTDWSSIGIDYLPLKRPTIFLDVPAPFKNGFNLGPEHRYGDVVDSFGKLKDCIEKYLKNPEVFQKLHSKDMEKTQSVAYGDTLDGRSTERYFKYLKELF